MSARADSQTEVVVVGAGPAGLSTAIELTRRGHAVTVFGRISPVGARPGEQLSGEGVLALQRLCGEFDLERVGRRSPGVQSAWGERALFVRSELFQPYGPSLTIDRHELEQTLLATACALGVTQREERVLCVAPSPRGVRCTTPERVVEASFAVDASGPSASLARALGARILRSDRLVGVAAELAFSYPVEDCSALVESTPTGYWYSVPLSASSLLALYFTDAEQLQGISLFRVWQCACQASVHTRKRLHDGRLQGELRVRPACSQRLDNAAGRAFLAVGDAAMTWDPLSSSGLTHALCTSEEAASAVSLALAYDPSGLTRFAAARQHEFARYLVTRARHYRAETRFSDVPFWRRRAQPALPEITPVSASPA